MEAVQQERQKLLRVVLLVAAELRREARERRLEAARHDGADAALVLCLFCVGVLGLGVWVGGWFLFDEIGSGLCA